MEKKMDDRVYCKNCASMPNELVNGEYKTWKGQCKAGDPWWTPDLKNRCTKYQEKKIVAEEIFWD
jgi:hypothetical protein